MRRVILCAALVVGAWGTYSRADGETYAIKLRKDQPGDKTEVTKAATETTKSAFSVMGQQQTQEEQKATKTVYSQEILERPADAKRPTKLVRTYQAAERGKNGKVEKLPYHGKTLTIEKKGPKYAFTIDGAEITGPDADELEKEFNRDADSSPRNDDFLPGRPVKVNEEWTIDPAKFVAAFEKDTRIRLDADKTKATGKLTKAYKKGEIQYGVMELNLTLPTKAIKQGNQEIALKEGSKFGIKFEIDACIDGTLEDGGSTMKTEIFLAAELPTGGLTITGGAAQKSSVKTLAKK